MFIPAVILMIVEAIAVVFLVWAWKAENEKIKKNKDAYYGSIWIQKELDKSLYRKHKRYR